MKKHLQILFVLLLLISIVRAQLVPVSNATLNSLSLTFASTGTITQPGSVVYNPTSNVYYIYRIGAIGFPLETLSSTGTPLFQTTTAIDYRGGWWNPNTNQVETNGFNIVGWAMVSLNASSYAINLFTSIFSGSHQPNPQSVGAYDYKNNQVIFYNGDSTLHRYNRNTGVATTSLTLTGYTFTNMNVYTVIYTGQTGYEIGLLDYVAKKVVFFNSTTGVKSAETQLPASAVTHNQFRFSYSNYLIWLFNSTTKTWNSYTIYNITLPVELTSFTVKKNGNNNILQWSTASEKNNDYFDIERSNDGISFEKIETVKGNGNSNVVVNYSFVDENPLIGYNYYRLKQVDNDKKTEYSKIIYVIVNSKSEFNFQTFTENELLTIFSSESGAAALYDNSGRLLQTMQLNENSIYTTSVNYLAKGIYLIHFENEKNTKTNKIIIK